MNWRAVDVAPFAVLFLCVALDVSTQPSVAAALLTFAIDLVLVAVGIAAGWLLHKTIWSLHDWMEANKRP